MKILMLATGVPNRVGTGAAVRTFHFAKALASCGDLHLALISPEADSVICEELKSACSRVILPTPAPMRVQSRSGRVDFWKNALLTVLLPWRNNWVDFLFYASGCGLDIYGTKVDIKIENRRLTYRMLQSILKMQLGFASRCFTPLPLMALEHWGNFKRLVPEIQSGESDAPYDLIWFEHGPLFPLASMIQKAGSRRAKLMCNAHNIEWDLAARVQALEKDRRDSVWLVNQPAILKRTEIKAFTACDLVFVCSAEDHHIARKMAPSGVFRVVGNGVDTSYFRPSGRIAPDPNPTLLFTGTMTYAPNIDAVRFFLEEIFPLIRRRVPDCRFVIAGRGAERSIAAGCNLENVEWNRDPDDMRPLFERAWVAVVPLRSGGGTRLKIPEALAMECPVISTSVGAEGVAYEDGEHLLLVDSPGDFANRTIELLESSTLRKRIANKGSDFVRNNYGWHDLALKAAGEIVQTASTERRADTN